MNRNKLHILLLLTSLDSHWGSQTLSIAACMTLTNLSWFLQTLLFSLRFLVFLRTFSIWSEYVFRDLHLPMLPSTLALYIYFVNLFSFIRFMRPNYLDESFSISHYILFETISFTYYSILHSVITAHNMFFKGTKKSCRSLSYHQLTFEHLNSGHIRDMMD